MNPERDQGLSLRSALAILRRRLPVLMICMLGVPLAALGFSLLQEKQYTADASLLFRDPALDQKLFGSTFLQSSRDPSREAATNVWLVSLDEVADRTARRLPGGLSGDDVSDKVDVVSEGQADAASVEATDPDPRRAAAIANAFATTFIDFRREADRATIRNAQALVQRQLDGLTPDEMSGPRGRSLRERGEQLQILGSLQTGNAELVQRATAPDSPSSPATVRNVALGIVLGLLLGIGLAFLLERLDRRIRDPRELEDLFQRPMLASVPESREIARGGPAGGPSLPSGDAEAFRMLRANLRYFSVDRPIRSVLITSAAPGDGKSTVCWNLALAAASAGSRVLLVETDLRHPSLGGSANELALQPGLSTVLSGQATLQEAIQEVVVPNFDRRTLDVIVAGPIPPNPVDLIESERMHALIRDAEQQYDLVVLDTPPTSVVSDAIPLLRQVSGVIVVARLGKSTRESLNQLKTQLEHLKAPTLGIVVNAFRMRHGYGYGYGYGYGEQPGSANGGKRTSEASVTARRES